MAKVKYAVGYGGKTFVGISFAWFNREEDAEIFLTAIEAIEGPGLFSIREESA